MTTWWQLTLAALFGAALVDLSLFGWTLRALGFGPRSKVRDQVNSWSMTVR